MKILTFFCLIFSNILLSQDGYFEWEGYEGTDAEPKIDYTDYKLITKSNDTLYVTSNWCLKKNNAKGNSFLALMKYKNLNAPKYHDISFRSCRDSVVYMSMPDYPPHCSYWKKVDSTKQGFMRWNEKTKSYDKYYPDSTFVNDDECKKKFYDDFGHTDSVLQDTIWVDWCFENFFELLDKGELKPTRKGFDYCSLEYPEFDIQIEYKNNKKHGQEIGFYTLWEFEGECIPYEHMKRYEGKWSKGRKEGKWIYYSRHGEIIKTEVYSKGILQK